MSVGWTGGGSVGAGAGGSVGDGGSTTAVDTAAVRVTVIPGMGVGRTGMVGVGVGGGLVGGRVASLTLVFAGKEGWARSASRLDIKPVKATYSPKANTNKTIRNPNAYPLFIEPAMPSFVLGSDVSNEPWNYTPKAGRQQADWLPRAELLQSRGGGVPRRGRWGVRSDARTPVSERAACSRRHLTGAPL